MNTDYIVEPENDKDVEFVDMLAEARSFALENDMDPRTVAYVYLMFGFEVYSMGDVESSEAPVCPECGEDIGTVSLSGLGEEADVEPCGCVVGLDALPDEVLDDILKQ